MSLGINADVPTPASNLSIRVGVGYVRRGSVVWDSQRDSEPEESGQIRSHYLSFPVQGKMVFRARSASAYLFAGPILDQLLETGCTQDLCGILQEEKPTVLSLSAGSGISFDVGQRFRLEFEAQLTEAVSEAYQSSLSGVRYRTVEMVVRAGFPF